jgi:hypothetical protein
MARWIVAMCAASGLTPIVPLQEVSLQNSLRRKRRCKGQDTLEFEARMNVFSYDYAFILIDFYVCRYKCLYEHIHKHSFTLGIQNGRNTSLRGMTGVPNF